MDDLNPLAQFEVQERIHDLLAEAAQNTINHTRATEAYYRAARRYKVAYSQAYRQAVGTIADRECQALLACEELYAASMDAEGVLKACQEAGRNTRAQMEATRTLAADIRDAVVHASGRGG